MASVDIEDVWNTLGFGRMQLIIFFSCCLTQMYVSNEQIGLSVILVASACDLQIDNKRMGWLVACVFFGQFVFGHYFGIKADKIGRLKVLRRTATMGILASFLSAFMPEFWSFLLLRFVVGVFLTGISVTLLTYLSEFTKLSLRPSVNNFLSYPIGVSIIYVPTVALVLFNLKINIELWKNYAMSDWRILIIINLLPGIIGVCMLHGLPESAKFYLSVHKYEEAMEVLERCCRMNKGKNATLASLGVDDVTHTSLETSSSEHNSLASLWYDMIPLFKGKYLRYMAITSIATFICFALGFGLAIWILRIRYISQEIEDPLILCDMLSAAHNSNISFNNASCTINDDNMVVSIVSGCVTLIVLFITSILFLFIKRRTILLIYMILAAIDGSLLNVLTEDLLIVGAIILFVVFPLCSLRLVIAVVIDLIPTQIRAKAVALTFMAGRLGVVFASLFVGYTLQFCCMITFNTFVLCLLIGVVMIFLLPTEKSLQNVEVDESQK